MPAPSFPAAAGAAAVRRDASRQTDSSRARASRPRDPRAREEPLSVGGEGGSRRLWLLILQAGWRWRRELVPLALAVALLVFPAVGHATSEGLAWAPLLAGLLAGAGILLWGHRPIHRRMAYGAAAAGAWAAGSWWVGLLDPVVLSSYLLLVTAAAAAWIGHVHPRPRIRVLGGSAWPWQWERWQFQREARREIRRAMGFWAIASAWGKIPRSEIRAAVADIEEDHYLLTVELVPGHLTLDLDPRRAASAIGTAWARVTIVLDDSDSDRAANVVLIRWMRDRLPVEAEESGEEELDAGPEPVDAVAERLARLRTALRQAGGPVSARRAASLARLDREWVRAEGLPALEQGGEAWKGIDGKWQLRRAA